MAELSDPYVCPACGTTAAGASVCGACGLDLDAQRHLPRASEYALSRPGAPEVPRELLVNPPREFASWGQRLGAYCIDVLFFFVCALPLLLVPFDDSLNYVVSFGFAVAWLLYVSLASAFNDGQTLGKWLMKIRVVHRAKRAPVGVGRAFGRELARGVLWLIPLGSLADHFYPFVDEHQQTFHDKVAGTVVVPVG